MVSLLFVVRRIAPLALTLCLSAACHGIAHPTAPTPVAADARPPAHLVLVASPGELPIGGGSIVVSVGVTGADGAAVMNVPVTLTASAGALGEAQVTTDVTGHATATWQGTETATITGTAGDVTSATSIGVHVPPVELPSPPPHVPPTTPIPAPSPAPAPLPAPPPSVALTLTATPVQVAVNTKATLVATIAHLPSGVSVSAYEWDYEGVSIVDETSLSPTRTHVYTFDGIKVPIVRAILSSGKSLTAKGRVIVYQP